ncbi:hypothetical protein [Alteromonas sp. S015]|uniref:hypothetical protein n=1 Tax=Alteromonas sp. S015 TaxID=3117401 RepID=UPI002FE2B405
MKFRAIGLVLAISLLTACGGHGFEGQWKMDAGKTTNKYMHMAGVDNTLTIGDDFIESEGTRVEMDIFTRESNDKNYLIFKTEDGREQGYEIIDNDTLISGRGFAAIRYKRM